MRLRQTPATLAALIAATLVAVGCADRRRSDRDLGGLVHAESDEPEAVDVDRAAKNVGELVRALAVPHRHLELGPHTFSGTSSVTVRSQGKTVEELSDKTEIAVDAEGNFRATADNDREYGRHAIFTGGTLYLRPRYGKYHARAPNIPSEPATILDEMTSTASAYFDLLWTGAELSDRGATSVDGRAARKIEISAAPTPASRPAERLAQRKWRESIGVDEVSGEVVLDNETGAPLSVTIKGAVHYVRDGVRFEMSLAASHRVKPGQVAAIAAPPEDQTVSAPAVSGEVAERKKLLEGLSSSSSQAAPGPAPDKTAPAPAPAKTDAPPTP